MPWLLFANQALDLEFTLADAGCLAPVCWRPLRAMFKALLAPVWLWITIGLLSIADIFESVTSLAAVPRLLIIVLGIAYFHLLDPFGYEWKISQPI